MNTQIENSLDEEILNAIEALSEMDKGSEEWKKTVEGLAKLLEKTNERDKFEAERREQDRNRRIENFWREEQAKEERIDRWVKNGIAVAGIVIPVAVTIWGTLVSFKFEEEGTITTIMGRGFINKLLPKK